MTSNVRLIWDAKCLLGEGPAWFPGEQALRFVDIKRGQLHHYSPAGGAHETLELGGAPSFIVPTIDGGMAAGSRHSLYRVAADGFGPEIASLPMPSHNRTNDATVDCTGRLWFGTMDDNEEKPTGELWCFAQGKPIPMGNKAVVTNGPAITSDGRYLYHVDSGERTIWRLTLTTDDRGIPLLAEKHLFLKLEEADGYPDGIVLDSENCLWVALWDGWGVRRYSPDAELLDQVALPCARVTKLAFGGPDLRTAFVTTACIGLGEAALATQPLAGALFAFDSQVAGLPLPRARIDH